MLNLQFEKYLLSRQVKIFFPQTTVEALPAHIAIAVLVILGHGRQVGGEFGGHLQVEILP